jgi:hypothetical protein
VLEVEYQTLLKTIFGFVGGLAQEAGFEGIDQVGGNMDNEIIDTI